MTIDRAALRRAALRRRRIAVDGVLWRLEKAWARALDRHDSPPDVDPATGRTPRERLLASRDNDSLWPRVQDLIAQGADSKDVLSRVHEAVNNVAVETAATLRRTAPGMLRQHRLRDRAFRRRLRAVWGPALDAFYVVYVCMEELGSDLQQLHQDRDDDLAEALLGLQARAALLMYEIHQALTAGLPLAAWARARSLHETAVIAEILSEHGRDPGTDDLATRYLHHAVIDQARDLQLAAASGLQLDEVFVYEVEASQQELLKLYGEEFRQSYAWARPLFGSLRRRERVSFVQLELLAATGLSRFDYRVGSHHVHASAYTLHLNRMRFGDMDFRLTGPVNRELDGPPPVALAAALMTSTAVVYGMLETPPDTTHLLALAALREVAADVEPLLDNAAEVLDRREERVQRRAGPETWRCRQVPYDDGR